VLSMTDATIIIDQDEYWWDDECSKVSHYRECHGQCGDWGDVRGSSKVTDLCMVNSSVNLICFRGAGIGSGSATNRGNSTMGNAIISVMTFKATTSTFKATMGLM
jgi:hypothetical protein